MSRPQLSGCIAQRVAALQLRFIALMVARQLGFASPAGTSAGVRADPAGSPFYCPIGMVALTVPWSWWPPLVQIEPVTLHARPPRSVTSTSS